MACALYLLDKSDLKDHARGDPVLVSRMISAVVSIYQSFPTRIITPYLNYEGIEVITKATVENVT